MGGALRLRKFHRGVMHVALGVHLLRRDTQKQRALGNLPTLEDVSHRVHSCPQNQPAVVLPAHAAKKEEEVILLFLSYDPVQGGLVTVLRGDRLSAK